MASGRGRPSKAGRLTNVFRSYVDVCRIIFAISPHREESVIGIRMVQTPEAYTNFCYRYARHLFTARRPSFAGSLARPLARLPAGPHTAACCGGAGPRPAAPPWQASLAPECPAHRPRQTLRQAGGRREAQRNEKCCGQLSGPETAAGRTGQGSTRGWAALQRMPATCAGGGGGDRLAAQPIHLGLQLPAVALMAGASRFWFDVGSQASMTGS